MGVVVGVVVAVVPTRTAFTPAVTTRGRSWGVEIFEVVVVVLAAVVLVPVVAVVMPPPISSPLGSGAPAPAAALQRE